MAKELETLDHMESASQEIERRRSSRAKPLVNYKDLADVKLLNARLLKPKEKADNKLYPIDIVEQQDNRVRIHYVGYASEWRERSDLEWIEEEETPPYQPYSLYSSLLVKIKQAMSCGRKTSPSVHIVMSFDFL